MTIKKFAVKKKSFHSVMLFCTVAVLFVFYILFKGELRFFDVYEHSDIYAYIRGLEHGVYHDRLMTLEYNDFIRFSLSEPLWGGLVVFLNSFFTSNTIFMFIIPLVVVFITSMYLYTRSGLIYLIALFHPISTIFQLNQLRLALAISIFLLGTVFFKDKRSLIFLSLVTIFIHSSMALFLFSFFICYYVCYKINITNGTKVIVLIFFGFILSYITGPFVSDILQYLGDRRAEAYSTDKWQTSFLTSLYCSFFVFLLCCFYFIKNNNITVEGAVSVSFFSLVAFSYLFSGGYPMRYLSAVFPVLIVCGYQMYGFFKGFYFSGLLIIGLYILFF